MNDNASFSFEYVDKLVKANQAIVEAVEKDPELTEQYQADMGKLAGVKHDVDTLIATLFDQVPYGTRDEDRYRYINRPLGKSLLLRKGGQTETPRMIKNLRRLQLTEFSELAASKKYGKEIGFTLAWSNPGYEPSEDEEKKRQYFEQRIRESFFFPAGESTPSLAKFLGGMYEDFFDLDDITLEIHRDPTFQPIGVHVTDPSLWFHTIPRLKQYSRFDRDLLQDLDAGAEEDILDVPEYEYVMRKDDVTLKGVTRDVVYKSHFFTRSDHGLWLRGYGIMEQAATSATIILNAITFNASNFSNNRMPAGILAIEGGMTNTNQIERLKKILWANMSGAAQQRRLPIVGLPKDAKAEWVSIHNTAKEMEFYTGLTLFMSIVFALSGTDPNEVGLANFKDAIKTGGLNEAAADGVWKRSKDNGLRTFLSHTEATLNTILTDGKNVFEQATGLRVKAEFKGLAEEDVKEKAGVNKARLEVATSINEVRKENGEEPAEYKIGETNIYDIVGISNAGVAGFIRQDIQAKQQAEMQEQQMQAQQQAQAGQQAGQGEEEMTPADQELIAKYGQPEGGEEQGGAPTEGE